MSSASHHAQLPASCPRCGAAVARLYTAAYRGNGLRVAMGFRCEQCRDGIEWDGDDLDESARSAFYWAEGKWALYLIERGARGVEALQTLRMLRNESVAEVMRFVRSGAPIVEGTLVEIEYFESKLADVGATTERRRIEGDDPDLLLAATRMRPVEEQLRPYEDLWTIDAHRYEIHRPRSSELGVPVRIDGDQPMALLLIDVDEHLYEQIIHRMLAAGVPVRDVTPKRTMP